MKDNTARITIDFKEFLAANLEIQEEKAAEEERAREAFVSDYPISRIREMEVDEYCLGTELSKDSFCYAIEFGRYKDVGFGIGGATAKKHGVFYSRDERCYRHRSKKIEDIQAFWPQFREQLYQFLVVAENSVEAPAFSDYPLLRGMGMVLTKLLCLYYPDRYLSIGSMTVLKKLMDHFGYDYAADMSPQQINRRFTEAIKQDYPELSSESGLVLGSLSWNFIDGESEAANKKAGQVRADQTLAKETAKADKVEVFELTITKDAVVSTDDRFMMDNLELGNNYKPTDVWFSKADGTTIKRKHSKGEWKITNQTLPKLAIQVFEDQIANLTDEEKASFPVCRYTSDGNLTVGIYPSVEEFRTHYNTIEYLTYTADNGRTFVIYTWNLFSTIVFVQECLKRFGEEGDRFILQYRDKVQKQDDLDNEGDDASEDESYRNPYSRKLIESKNIVFRGAPGTGKTFLARAIATDIVSNGRCEKYEDLTEEQKEQIGFVQFHPSYDYSDFVEGLRPKIADNGTMAFELQNGIFKDFADKARRNLENSRKSVETIEKEASARDSITEFFSEIEFGVDTFQTVNGNEFTVTDIDENHISISIPGNATVNKLQLNVDEIQKMLESEETFERVKDVRDFFGKTFATQGYSYDFALYKAIKAKRSKTKKINKQREELKKYVFIIDEINRGEISKIFGELFFSIDPGYRGEKGAVLTQYANLHPNQNERFYIPENLYIIGTMNDIDRSVDSFDFAMRRRFRFIELRAEDCVEMLNEFGDEKKTTETIARMNALNKAIVNVEELNENYQVGAAYFLKLKSLELEQLWTDHLQPLLQEYVRGLYNEKEHMQAFKDAYDNPVLTENKTDEAGNH